MHFVLGVFPCVFVYDNVFFCFFFFVFCFFFFFFFFFLFFRLSDVAVTASNAMLYLKQHILPQGELSRKPAAAAAGGGGGTRERKARGGTKKKRQKGGI